MRNNVPLDDRQDGYVDQRGDEADMPEGKKLLNLFSREPLAFPGTHIDVRVAGHGFRSAVIEDRLSAGALLDGT